MKDELDGIKKVTNEFMHNTQQKILQNMDNVQKNTNAFKEYVDSQKLVFEKIDIERIAGNEQVKKVYLDFEKLKELTQSKLDQVFFDIDRRAKVHDVKQNFEKLNEILIVKFKQIEDTKQAMRNLVTY